MLPAYLRQVVNSKTIFKNKILLRGILFLILLLSLTPLFSQEYGFMYISNASSTSTLTNTWNTVGTFTEGTTSGNWSYASNTLTAASSAAVEGLYSIKYSLTFEGDVTSWEVGISINGAAPTEPVVIRTIASATKDKGNVAGILMASITQGQTVRLQVKPAVTSSDFTPIHAQVVLIRAAQRSVNYYGGMHIGSDQTYTNIGTNFIKLTGFSAFDELNGWTFGTSDLTANTSAADGLYYVSFSGSLVGDGGDNSPVDYSFEICRNDSNNVINVLGDRIASINDIGNMSVAGLVEIDSGDVITIEGKGANSKDLTLKKATLSLFKVVDSTDVKYAAMKITSDQTVTISTQNEWTTVGTYTAAGLNGWSFASNVFTPSSTDTYGYSFLEYALSCTTANASGDVLELGIFIGSYIHPEFSTMRKLRSNTDIASICGIGIFKVDGPDSTITLKVRNTTSTNNLVIRRSLVGTQQIRYVYSDTPLPISLNSFNIEQQGGTVRLRWETASEIENLGYKIYRKENDSVFEEISSYAYNDALRGQGTTTEMHDYEFIDTGVESANEYTYLLSDISYQMEEVKHIDFIRTIYLPEGVKLGKACPNPFNPQCVVPFTVDVYQHVRIDLLDVLGRRICTLTDRDYDPGNFQLWINNPELCSGIYFIRAQAGNQIEVQKIMMMK